MKVLLVHPPRYFWPYINEQDNFMLPQSLVCLAAVAREAGFQVKIIDCLPSHIGWRSLARLIAEEQPEVVAAGENHALFVSEVLKLVKLVKQINPSIKTVLGGGHFSALSQRYLLETGVDFMVRGEGERTFVELLQQLDGGAKSFNNIAGLAFLDEGSYVQTPPRLLIEDLDSLPLPAYDLVPMARYGTAKYLFSPGGVTIHHSRGCTGGCGFCSFWTTMAERTIEAGHEVLKPRWRTKSAGRVIEEISLLKNTYDKNCLVFVDDSFNINAEWNEHFAEALIAARLEVNWFAFMRADMILRDERAGIFEKLVASGLTHVCIGAERTEDADFKNFGKPFYHESTTIEAFDLLRTKYPQVFRQVTFIVGTRTESEQSFAQQLHFAKRLHADYPALHPLTPVPGTRSWDEARQNGWLELEDFDYFDWMTPVMSSEHLSREEIAYHIAITQRKLVNLPWLLKGLLSRNRYRRHMYIWWTLVTIRVFYDTVKQRLNPFRASSYTRMIEPDWYQK